MECAASKIQKSPNRFKKCGTFFSFSLFLLNWRVGDKVSDKRLKIQ
jgi:hypothetical protein